MMNQIWSQPSLNDAELSLFIFEEGDRLYGRKPGDLKLDEKTYKIVGGSSQN